MKCIRFIGIGVLLTCLSQSGSAQLNLKRQIPEKMKYEASKVIDSIYGIIVYEPLNIQLSGDSIRMCSGYACQNWVEDVYTTGEPLHKGFYIDGQLKNYKNFYPNGTLEREYKSIDNYKSTAKLYYSSGKLKSDIKYSEGIPECWTDYNENGVITYSELSDKTVSYIVHKKFFYDNGTPHRVMEISDKKTRLYTYFEYYPDGKVKVEGQKIYNEGFFDYVNHGKWKYYDESGKVIKQEEYKNGERV